MSWLRTVCCGGLLLAAAALSSGCYVMKDQNGQWWACGEFQTPNGAASACTPVDKAVVE